jgi:integrase
MAAIQERKTADGKRHYRVLVRLKGHPAQSATFQRKTDAKRWAQQTEAAIREGRYFKTLESGRRTAAEMIDRYLSEVLARKSDKDEAEVRRQLGWWRGSLGEYLLRDVTPSLIGEQRDRLGQSGRAGRAVSPATQNRYLQVLSQAFTAAVSEWEWLDENPVRKVRRLKEPRGRVRFLSDEERERLLQVCRESSNPRLYPLVLVAVSTGARSGELLALRWPDVDFERRLAVLHDTKNGDRRAIPLAGLALEELKRRSKVRRIDTDLVFANPDGVATFPRKAWKKALQAADIENFRFHDLRHTAASYLAMTGATLAELAEILGHKTLAMVKRYAHLTEQHTSTVVARMNERMIGG